MVRFFSLNVQRRNIIVNVFESLAQNLAAHVKEVISERELGRQWVSLKHHREVVYPKLALVVPKLYFK